MQVCYGMQVPFRPGTHLFKQSVFLLWQVTCKTHQGTHACLANKNIDRVYTNMGGWALSESYLGRSKPCTLHLHQNESPILWCAESANKTIDDFYKVANMTTIYRPSDTVNVDSKSGHKWDGLVPWCGFLLWSRFGSIIWVVEEKQGESHKNSEEIEEQVQI